MRTRTRGSLAVASLAVLAMTVAACGGSTKGNAGGGGSSIGSSSLSNGVQGVNPGTGTPVKGGTLNMLGDGDVDWMDYNASYYSIGYLAQRMYLRGLYAYPAIPGKVTTVAPDLATALPTVTQRRQDLHADDPVRRDVEHQPAAAGDRRGRGAGPEADLQPDADRASAGGRTSQPDRGLQHVLRRLRQGLPDLSLGDQDLHQQHNISGVTASGNTVTYNLTHPASLLPGPADALGVQPGPGREPELPAGQRGVGDAPVR